MVRQNGEIIPDLISHCERLDSKKIGFLDVTTFIHVFRYNLTVIEDELLLVLKKIFYKFLNPLFIILN